MNWVGYLIQKEISEDDSILDLGCGIMHATLERIPTYAKTKIARTRVMHATLERIPTYAKTKIARTCVMHAIIERIPTYAKTKIARTHAIQAILDQIIPYAKIRLQCAKITGVDIYKPYLEWLNIHYPEIETVHWDLSKTPLSFQDKSYDVVLLTDILEHLDNLEIVKKIISESNRIARKKIIILTPNKFDPNLVDIKNAWGLGHNEYQKHRSLIKKENLENWGFKVIIPKQDRKQYYAVKKLEDSI